MNNDWLNNFHEAANGVRTGIEYLERISDSLHFVGNEQLATKIDVGANVMTGDKWSTRAIRLSFSDGTELIIRSYEGIPASWLDMFLVER